MASAIDFEGDPMNCQWHDLEDDSDHEMQLVISDDELTLHEDSQPKDACLHGPSNDIVESPEPRMEDCEMDTDIRYARYYTTTLPDTHIRDRG